MTPGIVHHPDYIGGKWRFGGTRISVGMIARCTRSSGREYVRANYPDVTDEMIEASLNFDFPAIQELQLYGDDLNLVCACGEEILSGGAFDDGEIEYGCPMCGKRWRVTITLASCD